MNFDYSVSYILGYFNLIFIPIYCFWRFKKDDFLIFLNPLFYLLFASYFYLTISSVLFDNFINYQLSFKPILGKITESDIAITNLLCNWTVLVFLFFYSLSKNWYVFYSIDYKPRKKTYQFALFFLGISALIYLLVIIIYGSDLFNSSRREALEFYADLFARFRLENFTTLLLVSSTVLVWRFKESRWYLFLLLPIVFGMLAKDRDLLFQGGIFSYINLVILNRKTYFVLLLLGLVILLLFGLINDFSLEGNILTGQSLYNVLGEFFNTRVTTIIVYKNYLGYGNLIDYLKESLLTILPSTIQTSILDNSILDYHLEIKNYYNSIGINFGLAGNIVSEALFYGGTTFAIISPFIIALIFYILNLLRIYRLFPGFIFLCLLLAKFYVIMRSSFYDNFLEIFYLMFSYLIWLTWLEKNKIFLKSKYPRKYNLK